MQHILLFITNERLADLHTALNRALNTWEDRPEWLVDLTDALHSGQVSATLNGNNVQGMARDAASETLKRLGYTYHGGQLWKPPLGKASSFELRPYQQAVMNTLSSGQERVGVECPADGTMSPPIHGDDPLDMPLPCHITVGHGTHGKGTKLRTLVNRMLVLYSEAQDGARHRTMLWRLAMQIANRKLIVHKPDSVPMNREVVEVYCNDLYNEHLAETRATIRGSQS